MLLLPRAAPPDLVPLPIADDSALNRAATHDRELAAAAAREPLPSAVRALGSALRAFHVLEARGDASVLELTQARSEVDSALADAQAAGSA